MIVFLANRRVSILRGTVTDTFGDPKDLDTPVQTRVPASVRETRSIVTTVSDTRGQQIRLLVGRLPIGTDIRPGDRILDEASGETFIVDAIEPTAQSPVMDTGVRLDLRRVS